MIRGVRSGHPVADLLILGVATQAYSVGLFSGARAKADGLGNVPVAADVQTSGTVAVFAFYSLLGVKRVPEIAGHSRMACRACLGPNPLGACNLHVLLEGPNPVFWVLLCGYGRSEQKRHS